MAAEAPTQQAKVAWEGNEGDGEKTAPVRPWQLFRFAGPLEMAVMVIGIIFAVLSGLLMPYCAVIFGDSISASSSSAATSASEQMKDVVATFGYFCLAQAVLGSIWQTCWNWTSSSQAARMRKQYLRAVLYKDIPWFDVSEPAELPTRMAAEVQTMQDAIGTKAGMIFYCAAQFVGGFVVALTRGDDGWKLTLVICAAIPLFAISGIYMATFMAAATGDKQSAYGKAGAVAEEVLMAMRTVASFGGENREIERYCGYLYPAKRSGIITGFHMGASFGMVMAAFAFVYALAFWYAANEMAADGADVILVFFAVIIGVMSLNDAGDPIVKLSAAAASAQRIFPVLDQGPTIEAERMALLKGGAAPSEQGVGDIQSIVFTNVHFSYPARPDVPILRGLSLTISKGQKVALVGESGSGKSTAIQLLERFYDPATGDVKVNDKDLRTVSLQWWRKQIGYVGQEPVLFATSVKKNISGSDPSITDEAVVQASKQAQAFEFLDVLPQKLETYVGVGGGQMSGGQKQRIAIARALVKKPQILLLDEATSALDNESEKQVQATIDQLQATAGSSLTTISIAHRLSTIKNCTDIYFLGGGMVAEHGSHSELMAADGAYCKLVKTQERATEQEQPENDAAETAAAAAPDAPAQDAQPSAAAPAKEPSKGKLDQASPSLNKSVSLSEKEVEEERLKKLKEEKYSAPLGRLLKLSRPEWFAFPLAFLGPLLSGGAMPFQGYLLSQAIEDFYIPIKADKVDAINKWALWFVICGVGMWLGEILKWLLFSFIQESLALRIRRLTFRALLTQDVGFFDDPANTPGGLTTMLERQAKQVSQMTGISFGNAVGSVMGLVTGLVLAFLGSWKLALACLAMIPAVGIAITIIMVAQMGSTDNSGAYSKAGAISGEAILNIRTVRALSAEEQSLEAFDEVVDKVAQKEGGVLASVKKGASFGFGNSVQFTIYLLGFWYGAKLIDDGEISQSDMFQAMFCIMFGLFGAGMATAFAPDAAKGKLAAYDIFNLLDKPSRVNAMEPNATLEELGDGGIEFKDVAFHYPHRPELPVLRSLSFSVTKGQTVALVGPSGSGKSTVIQLLLRFYDPASGSVLVGGNPLPAFNIAWWRRQVALVGQEPVLFDMSLEENVKYAKPDASREEVEAAGKKANMDYVFNGKMAWTDSVGIRGGKLSGGQKQRCAIARAILREPSVLLLDEATSALDSVSEKEVQKALDAARAGRTTFTIAHRLSTIQDSDTILVIKKGELAERGTHDELMQLGGVYFNLAQKAH